VGLSRNEIFYPRHSRCGKAISLDPQNKNALNNRGLCYFRSGNKEKAKDDFLNTCNGGLVVGCNNFKLVTGYLPSEKIQYFLNKAEIAFNEKNWDQVIKDTSEIADDETALSIRGGAYAYKRLLNEAVNDCNAAIRKNPDLPLPYNNRAFAYELMGETADALLNYKFACNLKMNLACDNLQKLKSKLKK